MMEIETQVGNRLVKESSLYLLQHAYNPVDWYPWGTEALSRAKSENKPLIVSIGYSSCHWCHVMEKEVFEDTRLASYMNENFICIKIDREERPDIDQVFMKAVHQLGLPGGWPLNCFCTPEGEPFIGGTYFPPKEWENLINRVADTWRLNRTGILEAVEALRKSIQTSDIQKYRISSGNFKFDKKERDQIFQTLIQGIDPEWGGYGRAPKFPMPAIWQFILRYHASSKNKEALKILDHTLEKIASGGIYDHVGGGFARYTTDIAWKVPHFEKMLYDNAQLLSLYAQASQYLKNDVYRKVLWETAFFLKKEMSGPLGEFFSSIDADSEGIEGKYYCWTCDEIKQLLHRETFLFADYFNVIKEGNWENAMNILHVTQKTEDFCDKHNLKRIDFDTRLSMWKRKLKLYRSNRKHPVTDEKTVTAWNALTAIGFIDSYKAVGEKLFIDRAIDNIDFLLDSMLEGSTLYRNYCCGDTGNKACLDDYAHLIQALIYTYQYSGIEKYARKAQELIHHVIENFYDPQEENFFYTGNDSENLMVKTKEIFDNVLPSSNGVFAQVLFDASYLFDKPEWKEMSLKMLDKMGSMLKENPAFMANWGNLYLSFFDQPATIAIVGPDAREFALGISQKSKKTSIISFTEKKSSLPLLLNKTAIDNKTSVYICTNGTCKEPVFCIEDAVKAL